LSTSTSARLSALSPITLLRDMGKARGIIRTLNFMKVKFHLFKELVSKTPSESVFRDRGGEQRCQIFKTAFHRMQEVSVPRCKKTEKEGKRQVWPIQDLLVKLKSKRELHRQWKQRQVSWEEYRDTARLCRDEVRTTKAWLELNLERDARNNKKGFYRYVNHKRKVKDSVLPR